MFSYNVKDHLLERAVNCVEFTNVVPEHIEHQIQDYLVSKGATIYTFGGSTLWNAVGVNLGQRIMFPIPIVYNDAISARQAFDKWRVVFKKMKLVSKLDKEFWVIDLLNQSQQLDVSDEYMINRLVKLISEKTVSITMLVHYGSVCGNERGLTLLNCALSKLGASV